MIDLAYMLQGYIECAVWSSSDVPPDGSPDDDPEPLEDQGYTTDDIDPGTLARMRADVATFIADAFPFLVRLAHWDSSHTPYPSGPWTFDEQVGHDLWLTRNRHGAGFWDRGLGLLGDVLTEIAQQMGEADLMIGNDGRLHHS